MEPFSEHIDQYRIQMEKGAVPKAYKGLMEYMMSLRAHFVKKHPDYNVPGSIYFGYMDMTYFSIIPKTLKDRNLKVAVVLLHQPLQFEAWLAGVNKQVQLKYWKMIQESDWSQYHVVPKIKGEDAIVMHTLVSSTDFRDLEALTNQIEAETVKFIAGIEEFLSNHEV